MKLWLDDLRPFRKGFDIHCKTAEDALIFIKSGHVSFISFDNDLGEGIMEGYDLAKAIEELAFYGLIPRLRWNVHSANPEGERKIKMAMTMADKFWSGER